MKQKERADLIIAIAKIHRVATKMEEYLDNQDQEKLSSRDPKLYKYFTRHWEQITEAIELLGGNVRGGEVFDEWLEEVANDRELIALVDNETYCSYLPNGEPTPIEKLYKVK